MALIYGEFDNEVLVLNADVIIGGQGTQTNDLYVKGDVFATGGLSSPASVRATS